jgi:sec-independent protein translocase protein TatA
MFGLGMSEVLILCLLGLLLFGSRLPQLAHSLGKTVASFRATVGGLEDEVGGSLR